jgi:DNA-binding winged helix-turn-helix (wHTH) protein/Tol biopolymer transport system component
MPWLFGDYALDQERRQLLRAGIPLALEPKAYELLSLLLARRPRALSKVQIREVLWPGTFVSESALAGLITDLRALFGDDPRRPRFIRTVHGFGYAFCGEAREEGQLPAGAAGPSLRMIVLSSSGSPRAFDRPLPALAAALDESAGAALHVTEFTPGARAPALLQQLAGLAQRGQVLLSRAAFDLARDAVEGNGDGLVWLAHGPYLFEGTGEPVDVFEVGRPGQSVLRPPPDTTAARRTVRPGDEATLGWRPAPGLSVPAREGWTLLGKLGEGGFGEVWLAGHPSGERRVFKFCFEASRLRGLKREATLFRILKDELGDRDDIARVLDWNFDDPPYFLESEYTEGGSLVDWARALGGMGTVPLESRLLLIAQVAEALAAAHSVGILHKDVKPQNVLVTEDEEGQPRARLTDFGIGLVRDKSVLLGRDFTVTGFTEATGGGGATSGTRLYAAPEVLEGRTPTTLADIYALGVMLYQVIVGDLDRALAPGWERDVADELLREDIGSCVEGRPERRLGNALSLAERLRTRHERRTERERPRRARNRTRAWAAAGLVAAAALGVWLFRMGARTAERPVPQFRRITFQHGMLGFARFSADGQSVLFCTITDYSFKVFSVRLDAVEPRALGLEGAVAATTAGEMALISKNDQTLARVPLDGGVPREVAEHVGAADWARDGRLAIVRDTDRARVEFPLGHVVYEAGPLGTLEDLRVSPGGDRIAFIEKPTRRSGLVGAGSVIVIDGDGHRSASTEWPSIGGLAWSHDGREVWFTASSTGMSSAALYAFTPGGRERLVVQTGDTLFLHDISRDGRVLFAQGRQTFETRGRMAGEPAERDYSWLDGTIRARFARDGRSFLFAEMNDGGGPRKGIYLRRTDGTPPMRLGDGIPFDISPDGQWVVSTNYGVQSELRLVPTRAGEVRTLPRGTIDAYGPAALFTPDGRALVVAASEKDRAARLFVQELPNGQPRPFTPEGVADLTAISPDGRLVSARATGTDRFALLPIDGGPPRPIPGIASDESPLRFSPDGRSLLVWVRRDETRTSVRRIELATGRKTKWIDITTDPTGYPDAFDVTPDGRSYLYSFGRIMSDLYVAEGLR